MLSLHKHSSGRSPYWYAKFRGPDGRVQVRSTKQTEKSKAWEVAIQYDKAAQSARQGLLSEGQARRVIASFYEIGAGHPLQHMTTRTFLSEWLSGCANTCATGTHARYQATVDGFLESLGGLADLDLSHVTTSHIRRYLDEEAQSGKAPGTVNIDLKTLRAAFGRAVARNLIPNNPALGADFLPDDADRRERFTPEQLRAVLAVCDDEWQGLVIVGVRTGARLGRCATLRHGNIDRAAGVITYVPNKTRRGRSPKPIRCPLHADVIQYLDTLPPPGGPDQFLFPTLAKRPVSGLTGLSETFQAILAAAGIDVPRGKAKKGKGRQTRLLGFHSLRHTFISDLCDAGVDKDVRMEIVGHASGAVHARYNHPATETLKRAVDAIPSISEASEEPPIVV